MKKLCAILILVLLGKILQTAPTSADAALELYGTFEAMGVIINLASGDDPDQDATATVEYRVAGSGVYQPGFPLSRVSTTRFVGSLLGESESEHIDSIE